VYDTPQQGDISGIGGVILRLQFVEDIAAAA
jgi:hypothetical protein